MSSIDGELLAVENNQVVIQTGHGETRAIEIDRISEVEVQRTPSTAAWGVVGALSTISHGFFLVFTLPIWIGTGISADQLGDEYAKPRDFQVLRQYARFPQGMPRSAPPIAPPIPTPLPPPTPPPSTTPPPPPTPPPPAPPAPPPLRPGPTAPSPTQSAPTPQQSTPGSATPPTAR